MKLEREKLEVELRKVLDGIKHDRNKVNQIKDQLFENKISFGETQKMINGKEQLNKIDLKILCLLTIATYDVTKNNNIQPDSYFTKAEIKEAKTFEYVKEPEIKLPYTFYDVTRISDDDYIVPIKASEIKKFMDAGLLNYNFDTQREASYRRDPNDSGIMRKKPKIYPKKVKEIVELLKGGRLISSVISFNARLGSSDEGEELIYNEKEKTLTITEGTIIDCLDGFHRITAIVQALSEMDDLDKTFKLNIVNYSVKMAQEFFAQINTMTPVSQSRIRSISERKLSDLVVKELNVNSELEGKILDADYLTSELNFLTTFKSLSDGIDKVFDIKTKQDAIELSEYLSEFFNTLIRTDMDAFDDNIVEIRKKSIKNSNQMFNGYLVLAKKFKDKGIKLNKIKDVLKNIDFSRENPLWRELSILNENKDISPSAKRNIMKYFEQLDIEGEKVNV